MFKYTEKVKNKSPIKIKPGASSYSPKMEAAPPTNEMAEEQMERIIGFDFFMSKEFNERFC